MANSDNGSLVEDGVNMAGLPTEPQEKAGDSLSPAASPRHDPPTRMGEYAPPARNRPLAYDRAERAVQHLSKWAGPVALVGVVALIAWWIID